MAGMSLSLTVIRTSKAKEMGVYTLNSACPFNIFQVSKW